MARFSMDSFVCFIGCVHFSFFVFELFVSCVMFSFLRLNCQVSSTSVVLCPLGSFFTMPVRHRKKAKRPCNDLK